MNPDNIKQIAAGEKTTEKMMRTTLNNAARYIAALQLANGGLVVAALAVIRSGRYALDHPQRIAAHEALRNAVREACKSK